MSQIYVIAGVLGLISLLVCYIFIRQTIVKKKKEKARLQRALVKRAKFLIQTIDSFPQNFLDTELSILLLRSTVDTFEQLTQLVPDENQYVDKFKLYTQKLEDTIKSGKDDDQTQAIIDNSSQINEIRQSLNQLGRFIHSWAQRGNISQKQYGVYKTQIKKLIVQLMVDNYIIAAAQAVETEKAKLGIHYYTLAKNLILEEGLTTIKRKQLSLIEEAVPKLQATLDNEIQKRAQDKIAEDAETSEEASQWSELEEDSDWKKKNMYDWSDVKYFDDYKAARHSPAFSHSV